MQSDEARLEVHHELALIHFRVGRLDEAVCSLQSLWATVQGDASADTARHSRIREDYGAMAFNIGIAQRAEGDLHAALGYLLQSEATGFSQSARAALEVSRLLSNDIAAALDAGLRAEAAMAQLPATEQKALLRHLAELHRRSDGRARAQEYVAKIPATAIAPHCVACQGSSDAADAKEVREPSESACNHHNVVSTDSSW